MKKNLVFMLFALTFFGGAQQTLKPDFSNAKTIIRQEISHNNIPSISIAVVKGNKILWEESFGYADIEQKRKATVNTPYYLASLSKTITATAVLKLAEQQLINLDGPINDYLRGGRVSSPMWDPRGATVRKILSHTSGLTTFNSWCREDSITCAANDSVYISRYAIMISPPGKKFDYTNLGYGLLDRMISNVSNTSFPDYMSRAIFEPLGMKNSYVATDLSRSDRAIRYSSSDLSRFEFSFSHSYSAGASFIYSSVHDLAVFAMLHLNTIYKQNRIISEQSVYMMQDTVARNGSECYGLGWWINNDFFGYKGVLAQGGTFFANAWLQLIPSEDIAVAVITNSGNGDMSGIIKEVLSELLPKFKARSSITKSNIEKLTSPTIVAPTHPTKWKGFIKTYKGEVPVIFNFNSPSDSYVNVGKLQHIRLSNVDIRPDGYSFSLEGDLGLEDTGPGPYNLTFYLNREADFLYGSVETSSSVHSDTPQLAYWVKLQALK